MIKENQAEKFGGGIYTTGKLSLLGGSIQGNTTEGDSVERVINLSLIHIWSIRNINSFSKDKGMGAEIRGSHVFCIREKSRSPRNGQELCAQYTK